MALLHPHTPSKGSTDLCVCLTGTISSHSISESLLHYPDLDINWFPSRSKARHEFLFLFFISFKSGNFYPTTKYQCKIDINILV